MEDQECHAEAEAPQVATEALENVALPDDVSMASPHMRLPFLKTILLV